VPAARPGALYAFLLEQGGAEIPEGVEGAIPAGGILLGAFGATDSAKASETAAELLRKRKMG